MGGGGGGGGHLEGDNTLLLVARVTRKFAEEGLPLFDQRSEGREGLEAREQHVSAVSKERSIAAEQTYYFAKETSLRDSVGASVPKMVGNITTAQSPKDLSCANFRPLTCMRVRPCHTQAVC